MRDPLFGADLRDWIMMFCLIWTTVSVPGVILALCICLRRR